MQRLGNILLTAIGVLLLINVYQNASKCGSSTTPSSPSSWSSSSLVTASGGKFYASPNHLTNPLSGEFTNWNNVSLVRRSSVDPATQEVWPERLIAVFGLESSGTAFVQQVLATALNATRSNGPEKVSEDFETRVQHLSLPMGSISKDDDNFARRFEPLPMIPVFVPKECQQIPAKGASSTSSPRQEPSPYACHALFGPELVPIPPRYFVNVTSHTLFYQQRGVHTTAVLVVRDPALHFKGITKTNCPNQTAAFEQFQTGRQLLQEAMELLDPSTILVVSYETLMTLQHVYLQEIYKALGIESNYKPTYQNGNIAYISETVIPAAIAQKLAEDKGVPRFTKIPNNMYEPKTMAEIRAELESK